MKKMVAGASIALLICALYIYAQKDKFFFYGKKVSCLGHSKPKIISSYKKLTSPQAKQIMDSLARYIILDVRAPWEYEQERILGALLIPDYEFPKRALCELNDKNIPIFLYCKSGKRSAICAKWLIKKGYRYVYDFSSIDDWPYGTVSG